MSKPSSTNYPKAFLQDSLSHLRSMSTYTGCDGLQRLKGCSHYFDSMEHVGLRPSFSPHDKTNRFALSRFIENVLLGGYSSEVPPLPIPNREVKLTNADGTAVFPWESR